MSPPKANRRYTDNVGGTSRSPSRDEKSRNRPNSSITPSGTNAFSRHSLIPRSSLAQARQDPIMGSLNEYVDANVATLQLLMQQKRKIHMMIEERKIAL